MSKEHAYAYEAGYRDGSIHYELEHCPACKNIADLQEALEENAKLLEIIADLEEMLPKSERLYIHETANAIANDNAKLRKLVRDMWKDACQFDGFWDYVNDGGEIYSEDELPHYQERMRELGIEVD